MLVLSEHIVTGAALALVSGGDFAGAGAALAAIPGVQRFEQLRQTGTRNDFSHGFSMEFAGRAAYDAYIQHPVHTAFVAQRWAREVEDFLELDYQPLG